MGFKEYRKKSKETALQVKGKWSFLVWFIKTKECHYILTATFILLLFFMFVSPESVLKLKIALWNLLLSKIK